MQSLCGVGPQLADKLEKMNIFSPEDLLFHLPLRYQDRTRTSLIGHLKAGQETMIAGIIHAAETGFGRRRSLQVRIDDGTGSIVLRFFYFTSKQQQGFKAGMWVQCFGETRRGRQSLEMVHPEYRIHEEKPSMVPEKSLTPVYPGTEGIHPSKIRSLVNQALEKHGAMLQELMPQDLLVEFGLMPLGDALKFAHNPPSDVETDSLRDGSHPAQKRLALEELLAHHLALNRLRLRRHRESAPPILQTGGTWKRLKDLLGFRLTTAQERVVKEVLADIGQPTPTLRLIQGDVGSGKTVVAAAAALQAIDNRYQTALMAPTELLAEQHRKTFVSWFAGLGIQVAGLTGKLSAAERRRVLAGIESGDAQMIIGTHALFQQEVKFNRLGLLVIDEQHRFGVDQRLALRNKGNLGSSVPHQIIMSATPIPRSLAMIFYADLDVSSIDELPPGRQRVQTIVIPSDRRDEITARISGVCQSGQQVYWVCPLIEESDKLPAQAAMKTYSVLSKTLPELSIALIHGKLKSTDKERIMQRFSHGGIDLLVSTTVIEVGVDVPNANLMIIENAERLGLAQLHQLRGRVGRGAGKATCVLMYQSPLGRLAKKRLGILRNTDDGFEIAQKDLEHRGAGELLGTRQTGLQNLKIADFARDRDLLPDIEKIAGKLNRNHPELVQPLVARWITNSSQYANA